MQCKHHPDRKAEHLCVNCNAPICSDCAEEVKPGVYSCFQCAMLQTVSDSNVNLTAKHKRTIEKKGKKKKKWGPFQYFVVLSSVLIVVMWGVILFGGQAAPKKTAEFAKKGRVFLFLVDGALKRYAHYEGRKYPTKLSDLIPKYLSLKKNELFYLDKLNYETGIETGYRLYLANPKEGEMNIILSPKGIDQIPLNGEGA
jgi:hypothetical protein